jgi:hypothetical protein
MSQARFVQPTAWTLSGWGTQVRLSTAEPALHYQDAHEIRWYG